MDPRPYQMSRIVALPIFHAGVGPPTHFGTLKSGFTTYIMRRFELETFLTAVEKYGITEFTIVPPIAVAILKSPLTRTRPSALRRPWAKTCRHGSTRFWRTESLSHKQQDDTGSVGRLIPNVEAKLIDENGANISAYEVCGELCVRGPTVTPGYYKNDAANAEAFDAEGWFKTGDIAYCDGQTQKWYIVDRKKELIKVRGFQGAPPELETVLLGHPGIIDAAVIGVTFPESDGEAPRADVVRRPGEKGQGLTEKEVQQYLEGRLAKYKALTGGVRFVDAFAKNASGKILERELREQSQREIEAELGQVS
ncbi:AMP dependent CoA ligase [Aspergillus clavatus NRRL 1]|uniref:AMP dependent CoA ligase n=1 Tax=Aspergillus clavatus (strain ATCC 1007 / CBS 513.65 / DSM 816 / NCTC 3887 / NRRL 1 / QM 1276 / 107) TaxID=344612 RepID=A1CC00_ASPCL|nr:AMP dependent CoA ligase [Aspergillus clavatus NRRL 1]EAW13268.1 AMP dependent CoA ligase [Aspergillus clavatus NRRL 1]